MTSSRVGWVTATLPRGAASLSGRLPGRVPDLAGITKPSSQPLAPVDLVNLEDLWLGCKLEAEIRQDRHQDLAVRLQLLRRVPDFTDEQVSVSSEADVVLPAVRWKLAGGFLAPYHLLVLRDGQVRRTQSDNDAHGGDPPGLGCPPPYPASRGDAGAGSALWCPSMPL